MAAAGADRPAGPRAHLLNAPDEDIGNSKPKEQPARFMQVELNNDTVQDLQKAAKDGKAVQLLFGKNQILKIGNNTKRLKTVPATVRKELYRPTGNVPGGQNWAFAGLCSHSLAVQEKAQDDTAGGDEALAKLKANLAEYEKDRKEHQATFIDAEQSAELLKQSKNKKAGKLGHSRTSSLKHAISIPNSPHSAATPNGSFPPARSVPSFGSATATATEKEAQAKRQALLHLLALDPLSTGAVETKTKIPHAELLPLLEGVADKVAGEDGTDVWKMRPRYFKELDIFKFNYNREDRDTAVQNAIKAFDRQRVSREDPLWQKLLPPAKRGKGIVLSKLNLHGGMLTGATAPNSSVASLTSSNHRSLLANAGGEVSRASRSPDAARPTKPSKSEPASKRLLAKGKSGLDSQSGKPKTESQSSVKEKKVAATSKATAGNKDNGKNYKSAEYVIDSDSDDDDMPLAVSKPNVVASTKSTESQKQNRAGSGSEKSQSSSRKTSDADISKSTANGAKSSLTDNGARGTKRKSSDESSVTNKKARPDKQNISKAPKSATSSQAKFKEQTATTNGIPKTSTTSKGNESVTKTNGATSHTSEKPPGKKRPADDDLKRQTSPASDKSNPSKKQKMSPSSSSPMTHSSEPSMTSNTSPSEHAGSSKLPNGTGKHIATQAATVRPTGGIEASPEFKALVEEETAAWAHYWELRIDLAHVEDSDLTGTQTNELWRLNEAAGRLTNRVSAITNEDNRNPARNVRFTGEQLKRLDARLERIDEKYRKLHKHVKAVDERTGNVTEVEEERENVAKLQELDMEVRQLTELLCTAKGELLPIGFSE